MNGKEFYDKYKGKTVLTDDNMTGIVVGYEGEPSACAIIAITSDHIGWFQIDLDGYIIIKHLNNNNGFWYICDSGIAKIFEFKFGRKLPAYIQKILE